MHTYAHRRQSSQCLADLSQFGEEPYVTCVQLMGAIFPGSSDFSEATIDRYCVDTNCPAELKTLFEAIERDCGSEEAVSSDSTCACNLGSLTVLSLDVCFNPRCVFSCFQPDIYLLDLIFAACHTDPKGHYCAIDYNEGGNFTQYEVRTHYNKYKNCYINC